MDVENETRPLLPSFEGESWRSKARKRCMRIPSEITITGIILGLFLIVVTLLIVLENMETEGKDGLSLESNLLASPFKYNKKAEDTSWQDKKESLKNKIINKERKWDKATKGWKQFPDISGKIGNHVSKDLKKNWKDDIETFEIPNVVDEYGKEIENNLEAYLSLQMSDPNTMQKFNKDASEIKNLIQSKIKWKEVDDGWKTLSEQGWSDKNIRTSLFKAIKERREELLNTENTLQSPMKLEQIWDDIIDIWKKNVKEGKEDLDNRKMEDNNDAKYHKSINDEWKNEMNILQSPKSSIKKILKDDSGWQKLSEQGWKNKDIEEALLEAWKERRNVLQSPMKKSPMNIQNLWVKTTDFFKNLLQKGMDEQKSQKEINDEWAKKFNILQSPMSSYKKWKKIDELRKKHSKDDWKDKSIDKSENETDEALQSPINFEDFMEDIIGTIKDQGMDEAKSQLEINDEYAKGFNPLQSPMSSSKKWGKNDQLKKKHSKDDEKDKTTEKPNNEKDQPLNFEEFLDQIFENIKEYKKERNSYFGKNDGDVTSNPKDGTLQYSMPIDNIKWGKINDAWKKLTDQGWKDKDIKEAVYSAWKDGRKQLQSPVGYNNMKWKKVNDGWKIISNKSFIAPTRCPISKLHRELLLGSAMPSPPIDCALMTEEVRRKFGRCIDLSFLPKECKPEWREKCFTSYKYRKLDGTCNNKIHPTWGKSGTPFVRMIAPDYADGVSALRTAKDGGPLPNPRYLSQKLYSKQIKPDGETSILFLYFGLFIDHDVVETAVNSDAIPCCDGTFLRNPQSRPKECLQIDIPSDDPFYGPKHVTCLNLVRSLPVNGVCAGRREQLNKATSLLDASVVYGSFINQAKQLRTFSRGQLKTQLINNTPFMPNAEGAGYKCGIPNEPLKCFEAGDSRVNMMVELTAMHTLWHREHNRIAAELHKLNPQWRDEIIFQEARRILIGEFQHITYNEFLTVLLGQTALEDFELKIDDSKIYDGYDETVDPSIFNVFGAAAFRFGHSLVPDMQYLLGEKNSTVSKVPLHETFFNAKLLYHNGLDLLLRGAAKQKTQSVDSYISAEVREHLFQPSGLDYGYDLAAVGIQRGRDHGLPAYVQWRSVCGLSEVKTWDDLYIIMDEERADMFKNVYKSVEDIDLIPGALAEHHEEGSLVGPTYTCLIGRQFKKTRKGDRFWFEIQNEIGSLTRGQLDQIYKANMARILCDNSDKIKSVQRFPFKIPSDHNPVLDCEAIQKVDLSEWRSNV